MNKKLSLLLFYWLPVAIWIVIIFSLSAHPVPQASQIFWKDFIFKKSAHIFFHGILALLIYRALIVSGKSQKQAIFLAIFLTFLNGVSDEFHQSFVPGRGPAVRDVVIDTFGASLAIFLAMKLSPYIPKEILDRIV